MIDPFSATVIENDELRDQIAKLEAVLKLAREALRPFAATHFYVSADGRSASSIGHLKITNYSDADIVVKQIDEVLKC